jgi:hypothetical protein
LIGCEARSHQVKTVSWQPTIPSLANDTWNIFRFGAKEKSESFH